MESRTCGTLNRSVSGEAYFINEIDILIGHGSALSLVMLARNTAEG